MSTKKRNFLLLFSKIFRKFCMQEIRGLTIKEIAAILNIPESTVKVRIFRAQIKPITREAIYPPDTLDRIREAPMGRPRKARPGEPDR
jgi:FixJ family two-component response regulator